MNTVYWTLVVQIVVTLVLALISLLVAGAAAGFSALVGGAICVLTNGVFAVKLFAHKGARARKRILSSFYYGEALKLLFTGIFFFIALKWLSVKPLPMVLAYVITAMAMLPMILKTETKRRTEQR